MGSKTRGEEDLSEGFAGEVLVLGGGVRGFELRHAGEVAEEVGTLNGCRIYIFVPQFACEAAIAAVDSTADATQVAIVIVRGATVNMVDGHAGGNGFVAPREIDGMRGEDVFVVSPDIFEL